MSMIHIEPGGRFPRDWKHVRAPRRFVIAHRGDLAVIACTVIGYVVMTFKGW